jgi:hypothetical protein
MWATFQKAAQSVTIAHWAKFRPAWSPLGATTATLESLTTTKCLCVRQGCQMVYFQPNIPILVNFGRPWNRKCWYIL